MDNSLIWHLLNRYTNLIKNASFATLVFLKSHPSYSCLAFHFSNPVLWSCGSVCCHFTCRSVEESTRLSRGESVTAIGESSSRRLSRKKKTDWEQNNDGRDNRREKKKRATQATLTATVTVTHRKPEQQTTVTYCLCFLSSSSFTPFLSGNSSSTGEFNVRGYVHNVIWPKCYRKCHLSKKKCY